MNEKKQNTQTKKTSIPTEEWQARIKACQTSGLTVTEWCRQNGIGQTAYYRSLRKLREQDIEITQKKAVAVKIGAKPQEQPPQLPSEIRITADNINIILPSNVSPEQLCAVIRVLKSC